MLETTDQPTETPSTTDTETPATDPRAKRTRYHGVTVNARTDESDPQTTWIIHEGGGLTPVATSECEPIEEPTYTELAQANETGELYNLTTEKTEEKTPRKKAKNTTQI